MGLASCIDMGEVSQGIQSNVPEKVVQADKTNGTMPPNIYCHGVMVCSNNTILMVFLLFIVSVVLQCMGDHHR